MDFDNLYIYRVKKAYKEIFNIPTQIETIKYRLPHDTNTH